MFIIDKWEVHPDFLYHICTWSYFTKIPLLHNTTISFHTVTSRFPISPDLCPWPWPPPIGQALCLPTRPLGSHLWTRVRQQIYPASGLIPLLEWLPLASPELPLLFWPMAITYWTGLPTFQSGLLKHCLTCSQLDSSSCPELSSTTTLSLCYLRYSPDVRVPLPSDSDIFSNLKPSSPVVAAPAAVTTGMPSCGTFWNHFENHLLMHCDTLQYNT